MIDPHHLETGLSVGIFVIGLVVVVSAISVLRRMKTDPYYRVARWIACGIGSVWIGNALILQPASTLFHRSDETAAWFAVLGMWFVWAGGILLVAGLGKYVGGKPVAMTTFLLSALSLIVGSVASKWGFL